MDALFISPKDSLFAFVCRYTKKILHISILNQATVQFPNVYRAANVLKANVIEAGNVNSLCDAQIPPWILL